MTTAREQIEAIAAIIDPPAFGPGRPQQEARRIAIRKALEITCLLAGAPQLIHDAIAAYYE